MVLEPLITTLPVAWLEFWRSEQLDVNNTAEQIREHRRPSWSFDIRGGFIPQIIIGTEQKCEFSASWARQKKLSFFAVAEIP
jgi:hypothetical protein